MNVQGCIRPVRAFVAVSATFLFLAFQSATCIQAQRLPDTVRPDRYTLTLTPDLKAATFAGVETIDVTLAKPSKTIALNVAGIEFKSVTVTAGGVEQKATVSLDQEKEQAVFTFPDEVPAGKAALAIRYAALLNNELRGFYLSKTAKRNYAVTQFEATDARRAFPSFDEPALKATFDVSLVVDAGDTAISNGQIVSDTPGPDPGKHTLRFATTPKMSTYLVAFLVGDFQCTAGEQDGVAIRVCSTPDKVAMTPYSVDVAKYVLHYYNDYFGIPYPLKKLDLIALPDFEAGAMENFGAITYRETALLIDPRTASDGVKRQVALVIAHEMAHQWFGDLVTMQWWDNLWLNEGFATWLENKPVAAMHPEWNIEQIVAAGVDDTLNLDAQPTTHSIRAKADTRDEIEQMFDGISYGKASDVLLMVENYLGAETFRKGVQNYLAAHLYANATAEDFWNAQSSVSHKPVDKIMESLVAQPGEPLLTFGEPANGKVRVTQKRFFLSPSIIPDPKQQWTLPVCFKTGPNRQDCQLLTPGDATLKVPAGGLFFLNAGGRGFYRSAYPPAVYAKLAAQIETSLTPAERIILVGDEWAQLRANKATIGDYLDLVAALKSDPDSEVLGAALGSVRSAYDRVAGSEEERAGLSAWMSRTFAPEYAKLGPATPSDSPNTRELRAQLFSMLAFYAKDPAVLAQARQIAEQYLADPGSADATLGLTALSVTVRKGDAKLFDRLQQIYETSPNPELREIALRLLTQFEDPALAERSLDYALSGKVRNQDAALQFTIPLGTAATRDQAWKYIQTHWDQIQSQLTPEMGARLVGATASFCSADARESVRQFFAAHKVAASNTTLRHSIERIDGCIEMRTLQEPNLKQWLAAQAKAGASAVH